MGHTFSGRSTGKFRGIIGIIKKVALAVFALEISGEKACSIYEFSQGITGSSRLFTQGDICATILNFGDERISEWNLCQMERPFHGSLWKFLVNGKRPWTLVNADNRHLILAQPRDSRRKPTSLMRALHSHFRAVLRLSILFGRHGPNRVIEFACFDSKLQ